MLYNSWFVIISSYSVPEIPAYKIRWDGGDYGYIPENRLDDVHVRHFYPSKFEKLLFKIDIPCDNE